MKTTDYNMSRTLLQHQYTAFATLKIKNRRRQVLRGQRGELVARGAVREASHATGDGRGAPSLAAAGLQRAPPPMLSPAAPPEGSLALD
jgi:hypothetical protein